jgi:4-amino-4-deoxy-L-arabinose transferase-like glycosyltransferase
VTWWCSRWARVALCVALACLLYLPRLGTAALWEPDEGRYAEIAREMAVSGDYVTPRDDWVRYFEKPPLVYWAAAASIKLLGRNETAVRLPIALASIAQIAMVQVLAESMFGAWAGAGAALCLGLSPLFFGFSRFLTLDPVLAMFVTAALGCIYAAVREPNLQAGRKWLYLAAACAALGTLTKGPVALVLTAGTGLLYLLVQGRSRELVLVPWLRCALITAAIDVPWFAAVSWRNPGFLKFFFVHEHLERYTTSTEHAWGPWFFFAVVIAGMWPWICFVPLALREMYAGFLDRSAISKAEAETQLAAHHQAALRFAGIWFVLVFVFFSIPRSKLGSYILPALPAAAILAGYGLSRLGDIDRRRVSRLVAAIAAVNVLVVAASLIAAPYIRELRRVPALRPDLIVGVCAMALGAIGASVLWRSAAPLFPTIAALALGMAVALAVMVKAREDAAPLNSYRILAAAITRQTPPDCALASYRHHVQALPFYTGRREALVSYRGELAPWSWSADASPSFIATDDDLRSRWNSGACLIVVINRRDLARLGPTLAPPPRQLAAEGKKVAIINQAGKRCEIVGQ